mgnify:CR=1 FL=1
MTFNHADYQDIYPFAPHNFTHKSGLKQHYVDEGQGEPIVMVHGNPSWSFLYRDMIKNFRGEYRCIAPDHIGCGLSDKPGLDGFGYTLREHVDNLEALIESLQLTQPINLVVHDWGGAIGMGYATRHPEKIKRMVILNTGAFRLPKGCPFPWPIWLSEAPAALGSALITLRCAYRCVGHVLSTIVGEAVVEVPPPHDKSLPTETGE